MNSVCRMMTFDFLQAEGFACAFCVVASDYRCVDVTEGLRLLSYETAPKRELVGFTSNQESTFRLSSSRIRSIEAICVVRARRWT